MSNKQNDIFEESMREMQGEIKKDTPTMEEMENLDPLDRGEDCVSGSPELIEDDLEIML